MDGFEHNGRVDSMPSSALKQRLMPGVTRGQEGATRKMPLGRGSALNRTVEANIKPAALKRGGKANPVRKALRARPSQGARATETQGAFGPRGNV